MSYEVLPCILHSISRRPGNSLIKDRKNVGWSRIQLQRRMDSSYVDPNLGNAVAHESANTTTVDLNIMAPSVHIDSDSSQSISQVPRNKKLASIVRDGLILLNHSANLIQKNAQTSKSVFATPEDDAKPDARQLSEEHRIFVTAQRCLEDLCTLDSSFPLMAGDEPIMLLGVRVKPSYSHADLYWALPYSVLSTPELNEKQREYLIEKMEERVQGAPGRVLIQRINTVLSSYYPPKIRFKAAPPLLMHQVLYDLEED
jgi:hypothetical protein